LEVQLIHWQTGQTLSVRNGCGICTRVTGALPANWEFTHLRPLLNILEQDNEAQRWVERMQARSAVQTGIAILTPEFTSDYGAIAPIREITKQRYDSGLMLFGRTSQCESTVGLMFTVGKQTVKQVLPGFESNRIVP
jgi:hypothetical protein